jgi:glycosyltransferase involved in cell wall biosynthesis
MASAMPVIASDVAGHRALISDEDNGFLAGTLTQWEKRAEELLANVTLRERLGQAARRTVEERCSLDETAIRYLERVTELLESPTEALG